MRVKAGIVIFLKEKNSNKMYFKIYIRKEK